MLISFLQVLGGFVLLAVAAEALVFGAASLARRMGLSPLVIGLTVVSIGTSLPELVVGIDAALAGTGDLALGNVVGSNIGNLALILGGAALVRPIAAQTQVVRVDGPILVGVSVLSVGLTLDGGLGRIDGGLLLAGIVGYVMYSLKLARETTPSAEETVGDIVPSQHSAWVDAGLLALGLLGLGGGAHLLVDGAVTIAESLGVGPIVVGLTVVAVGTSLPELATSVVAARRGKGDLAVGNAVGSSIFNLLGILGATVLVQPLSAESLRWLDLGVMVGTALLILPFLRSGWTLSRREGAVLLLLYVAYLGAVVAL